MEKCIKFPSLSKEEYPLPILIVELKGLRLRQDLNPNSNISGYVNSPKEKKIHYLLLMMIILMKSVNISKS